MKDEHSSSVALPLIVVALFMAAVMAGGFVLVKKLHVAEASASATATTTIPTTGPLSIPTPTPIPIPTPTMIPTSPTPTALRPSPTVIASAEPGTPAATLSAVARLNPGFRSCYRKALASDPTLSGTMTIEIELDASGDVASVTKVGGLGLGPDVEACIMRRARSATFDAPGGKGTKVRVPLTFVSS